VRLHGHDAAARERARRIVVAAAAEAGGAGVFAAPLGLAWIGLDPAGTATAAW
jgi:H+/Cl- antiporter ClcA